MKIRLIFRSIAQAIEDWWLDIVLTPYLTEGYLSKNLEEKEFSVLKGCSARLNINYKDLFWLMDDLRVHNEMRDIASDKGLPEHEAFNKEEAEVVLKSQVLLNKAPLAVKEELRVFCHA